MQSAFSSQALLQQLADENNQDVLDKYIDTKGGKKMLLRLALSGPNTLHQESEEICNAVVADAFVVFMHAVNNRQVARNKMAELQKKAKAAEEVRKN